MEQSRRTFLYMLTAATGGVGLAGITWPMIRQMGPASDTIAPYGPTVDLSTISEGEQINILTNRAELVYIKHRTEEEIQLARSVPMSKLPHPESDEDRLVRMPSGKFNPKFLVVFGDCPRDSCTLSEGYGEYDAWYCPCCGAHYDTSGRFRRGLGPFNMAVPKYRYISETEIELGRDKIG